MEHPTTGGKGLKPGAVDETITMATPELSDDGESYAHGLY